VQESRLLAIAPVTVAGLAPEYQIVPLTPEHEKEIKAREELAQQQEADRRNLRVSQRFGDDALGYFTERLDPTPTRAALAAVLHRAKRNKAFQECRFVGLALDGTTAGRRRKKGCRLCRPYRNTQRKIVGYRHHLALAAVVGGDLTLPVDVEPYGPGDSEYAAGQRLLRRVRANLGARFIDYVVVDGEFATAPFLHVAGKAGWPVVARLKENLPELSQAAERRFRSRPPDLEFREGDDHVQIWDGDDFDPWQSLQWETVRVIRIASTNPTVMWWRPTGLRTSPRVRSAVAASTRWRRAAGMSKTKVSTRCQEPLRIRAYSSSPRS